MKEDAQLICPVSYEDPNDLWIKLQTILLDRLPLRDVTWKSPISSSYITIDKLPLRCLPASANLFKDTDHAFRWFLAPYVNFYLLQAETLESYRNSKASIKKWVDQYNGTKKSPWLVIYIPNGNHTLTEYNKIYAKLCGDFYGDRTGDRSVMLISTPVSDDRGILFGIKTSNTAQILTLLQASNNSVADLLNKMKEGVVVSFQHRSAMYDADIRRLDSYRGTGNFDFRTLFLVKESLALMYQMMQLPDNALSQYEELEATLSYAPDGVLLESDWPMVASESLKPEVKDKEGSGQPQNSGTSGTPMKDDTIGATGDDNNNNSTSTTKRTSLKVKDVFTDACKNGEDVVAYSINLARMKILQKKMSVLELHRYVFARQMYFLIAHLERPVACAEKSFSFMIQCSKMIAQRLDDRYLQSIREHELLISESMTANQQEGNAIGSDELSAAAEVTANFTKMYTLRSHQSIIWILSSCIKIVRVCRDLSLRMLRAEDKPSMTNVQSDSVMTNETGSEHGGNSNAAMNATAMRESSKILSELLQFALARLHSLIPDVVSKARRQSVAVVLQNISFGASTELFPEHSAEFLSSLEKEIELTGFDQDDLSSDSILISIAVKIKAICAYWTHSLGHSPEIPQSNDYGTVTSGLSFIEKVRMQEVSLAAVIYKAQWEMLQLAERYRFVVSVQMHCVDLFISSGAFSRASDLLECVLNCGLFTVDRFSVVATMTSSQNGGRDEDILNRSLGFGSASKSALAKSRTKLPSEIPQGDWLEMKFWILRKYLYCAQMCNDVIKYRVLAMQLLLPIFAKPVGLRTLCDESFRKALLENVIILSNKIVRVPPLELYETEENVRTDLELPLLQYFSVVILPLGIADESSNNIAKDLKDNDTVELSLAKGFQIIQDEIHPISALQCVGGTPNHTLTLKIHSTFSSSIDGANVVVVYKKFNVNTVLQDYRNSNSVYLNGSGHHFSAQNTPLSTPFANRDARVPTTGRSSLIVEEDEFECVPLAVDNSNSGKHDTDNSNRPFGSLLNPGDNLILLNFTPPSIGEYYLDRVVVSVGKNLIFVSKILSDQLEIGLSQVSTATSDVTLQVHEALQHYLDSHFLINVTSPSDLLQVKAITPSFTPIHQLDELNLQFSTQSNEKLKNLKIIAMHSTDYDDFGTDGGGGVGSSSYSAYAGEHMATPPRKASRSLALEPDFERNHNRVSVVIEDASEWNIDMSNLSKHSESNEFDVAFANVNSLTFDRVLESSSVHLKIPFYTTFQNNNNNNNAAAVRSSSFSSTFSQDTHNKGTGDSRVATIITVTLLGCMLRNGCSIMFELVSNFKIITGEALKVEIVNVVMSPSSAIHSNDENTASEDCEEVFIQAILQNVSSVPINLLSYDFNGTTATTINEESITDNNSVGGLMKKCLIDGPTDIAQYNPLQNARTSSVVPPNSSTTTTLIPGDSYYLGFVFSKKLRDLSEGALNVFFQRQDAIDSSINITSRTDSELTAKKGIFHKNAILPSSVYRNYEAKVPILSDFSCCCCFAPPVSGSSHSQQVSHTPSNYSKIVHTVTGAKVGHYSTYRYLLEFDCATERCPDEAKAKGNRPYWYYSEVMPPDVLANNNAVTLRRINPFIKNLEVQLIPSESWSVMNGVRVLSTRNLSSEYPNKIVKNSIVTISYELEMSLAPRKVGTLTLPSLQVNYGVDDEGDIDSELSLVVHLTQSEGIQSVYADIIDTVHYDQ